MDVVSVDGRATGPITVGLQRPLQRSGIGQTQYVDVSTV